MHKPKPIAEIPIHLARELGAGVNGCADGELYITFWAGDDDADLFLYLSPDEVKEIEDYGVSDDLIDWMRENGICEIDIGFPNDEPEDLEIFIITDEIVAKFYAT